MAFFFMQNLPSTETVLDVAKKIIEGDHQKRLSVAHLQAFVMGKSLEEVLKINLVSSEISTNFEVSDDIRANETDWTLMKKMIVNELFGTIRLNLGFVIRSAGISKLYSMIMKRRGIEEESITNTSLSDKVSWFLKELSGVKPDSSIITLYSDLYPDVNKQYFFSFLFRSTAFNIQKFPELVDVFTTKQLNESFLMEHVIRNIAGQFKKFESVELKEFMMKYLPTILRYIVSGSSNTLDENSENNVFSISEFINAHKEHVVNIDPIKIFQDKKEVHKKQTAEISSKKEGVIQIQVATPPNFFEDKNESVPKTDDTGKAGNSVDKKSNPIKNKSNAQSTSRRIKGDLIEDLEKPIILKKNEKHTISRKENESSERMEKELVPNTSVKDFKHSDSVSYNIQTNKEESTVKHESVSNKQKKKHSHDDL